MKHAPTPTAATDPGQPGSELIAVNRAIACRRLAFIKGAAMRPPLRRWTRRQIAINERLPPANGEGPANERGAFGGKILVIDG